MRVLFLEKSPVWIHGLPNGFRDLGHQVLIAGPLTYHNIGRMISRFRPELAITVGWGPELTPEKQDWIREHVQAAGVPLVYWAVEDPFWTEVWSLPLIRRMRPDFVFTLCPDKVESYRQLGIRAAHMDFAHHPRVHHPVACQAPYRSRIAVVANAYPHVLAEHPDHFRRQSLHTLIRPLLQQAGLRVDFYGLHWDRMEPFLGVAIPEEWLHGHLPYVEANKVYSSAEIVIGLQNYTTLVSQRTCEILGSGGFLLTNDTPAVRQRFTPGRDLVVSSSPEETLRTVGYYLEHPAERAEISSRGRLSVANDTYRHRSEYLLRVLCAEGLLPEAVQQAGTEGDIAHYVDDCEEHIVAKGDTLWGIAQKYAVTVQSIMQLNHLASELIVVGQHLAVKGKAPEPDGGGEGAGGSGSPAALRPAEVAGLLNRAARLVAVDPGLLHGIAGAESDFGRCLGPSASGAYGIMQLMPDTAEELGLDRTEPWQNVLGGALYINLQLKAFGGDVPKALAAYNWGAGAVRNAALRYGEDWLNGAPAQTRTYVAKVLHYLAAQQGAAAEPGRQPPKLVALTFDDGPDNVWTPRVLTILEKYGIKATFMCVGEECRRHPQVLRRLIAAGHTVGNHSWDHPHLTKLPLARVLAQVEDTSAEIGQLTGLRPRLFRAPYLDLNDQVRDAIDALGYRIIGSDVDSRDWKGLPGPRVARNVLAGVRPGAVVLLHCAPGTAPLAGAVEALPYVVESLRIQGYAFAAIPDLLGTPAYWSD